MNDLNRVLDKLDEIHGLLTEQRVITARLEERFASPNNPTSYEVMNEQHKS